MMQYGNFTVRVELTSQFEYAEEYTVFNKEEKIIGAIKLYDSNAYVIGSFVFLPDGEEVVSCYRFFARPNVDENFGNDFATFGEAIDYLITESKRIT